MSRTPWAAIVTLLIFLISGVLWLFRRTWKKVQRERQMLRDLYAYNFGTEEIGMSGIDDESVEDRLERGSYKHDWMVDAMQSIKDDQRRIAETQEEIVEDRDIEAPDVRDLPEWDPGRYRDETEGD